MTDKTPFEIAKNRQYIASNPHTHAWVSASAGSGKTTVLVRRILRLLLTGTARPENITAITYTKAAASEMANRITNNLNEWAVCDTDKLKTILHSVLGEDATDEQINLARSLFARVLDARGGLKIQTIHSFCQSLLARFPLESGVPQGFKVAEDAGLYIEKAKQQLIKDKDALPYIKEYAVNINASLDDLFKGLSDTRNIERFSNLFNKSDIDEIIENLYKEFSYNEAKTLDDIEDRLKMNVYSGQVLLTAISSLEYAEQVEEHKRGKWLTHFINNVKKFQETKKPEYLHTAVLTDKGKLRTSGKFFTENTESFQKIKDVFDEYKADVETHNTLKNTACVYRIARHFISIYQDVKNKQNILDFGDIIIKVRDMLKNTSVADWVLFKTDNGHKHILLDEAQDTAPIQWEIITEIMQPFFESAEMDKTMFVVGDEKQSIYSFQGAQPKEFDINRAIKKEMAQKSGQPFEDVKFDLSFRTSNPVLNWVDNAFADKSQGVSTTDIEHFSKRETEYGEVKLLPALTALPKGIKYANIYAKIIAEEINSIIGVKYIASKKRMAQAGDIIVLVRKRNAFVNALIRELKDRFIPVEGADRVILNQQIAVQDLLSLLRFSILPEDDLNLACLLKSPLFGFDEESLFDIAYNRGGKSLWQSLRGQTKHADVINYLQDILDKADIIRPLETVTSALNNQTATLGVNGRTAFEARLGKICNDFIDALLIKIADFEKSNPPTTQGFLNYFDNEELELKREQDDSGNSVRIMTIHAAKGLESPIVIVPSCMEKIKAQKGIVWQEFGDNMLFVKSESSALLTNAKSYLFNGDDDFKTADTEEGRRLMYVAMTRAEDILICGGFGAKGKDNADEVWYDLLLNGVTAFKSHTTEKFVTSIYGEEEWKKPENFYHNDDLDYVVSYSYNNKEQCEDMEAEQGKNNEKSEAPVIPGWAITNALNERQKYIKISPSQSAVYEPPALISPLAKDDTYDGRNIGNIIHKCLEVAPNITEDRKQSVKNYLASPYNNLNEQDIESIADKIEDVINTYPYVFDNTSKAEAPISGVVNVDGEEKLITGFIDRLCFVDNEIWIVDYKSNRNPPQTQAEVPEVYIKQLSIYKQVIENIYPDKTVKTKLLWTYNLDLMDIQI